MKGKDDKQTTRIRHADRETVTPVVTGIGKITKDKSGFRLEVDAETAKKFEKLLSEDNLIHAGLVAHEANNVNIPEVPEHSSEG